MAGIPQGQQKMTDLRLAVVQYRGLLWCRILSVLVWSGVIVFINVRGRANHRSYARSPILFGNIASEPLTCSRGSSTTGDALVLQRASLRLDMLSSE